MKKVIVWFDTEQSRYHSQKALMRALRLAGVSATRIEFYTLRKIPPQKRVELVEYVLRKSLLQGVIIELVVIDGVRDLVVDYNSPAEATTCASNLLRWTEEYNLHIVTVLHQNKGDSNAKGHLGAELTNKAQTIIRVEKSEDDTSISIVSPGETRDEEFDKFAFQINEDDLPEIVEDYEFESKKRKQKVSAPPPPDVDFHKSIAIEVFSKNDKYNYEALWKKIKSTFKDNGKPITDNGAKKWVNFWMENNIIIQANHRAPYRLSI